MSCGRLFVNAEEGTGDSLVQQHGQYRNHCTLQQVQRSHTQHGEGGDVVNAVMDSSTHGNDGVQRQTEKLGELGQKIHRIESASKKRHGHSAQDQTNDGAVLALVEVIPEGGGQHEGAANHKVCQITHKGGGGALNQQLQQDLNALTGYGGAGS